MIYFINLFVSLNIYLIHNFFYNNFLKALHKATMKLYYILRNKNNLYYFFTAIYNIYLLVNCICI